MSDYRIRYLRVADKEVDGFRFAVEERRVLRVAWMRFITWYSLCYFETEAEAKEKLDLFERYGGKVL